MKQEQLNAPTLISILSVAAVELYALGRQEAAEEVAIIRSALPLIPLALGTGHAEAAAAETLLQRQHELLVSNPNAPNPPLVMDADLLFQDPDLEEILLFANSLLEVILRLETEADRTAVAALLRYMMRFWQLEDWLEV